MQAFEKEGWLVSWWAARCAQLHQRCLSGHAVSLEKLSIQCMRTVLDRIVEHTAPAFSSSGQLPPRTRSPPLEVQGVYHPAVVLCSRCLAPEVHLPIMLAVHESIYNGVGRRGGESRWEEGGENIGEEGGEAMGGEGKCRGGGEGRGQGNRGEGRRTICLCTPRAHGSPTRGAAQCHACKPGGEARAQRTSRHHQVV